jgi:dihydrolipoamide dehydrogenase
MADVPLKPDPNANYDAIWFGGGAAGRFGAAYLQALGGRPLIVEKHGLGGECHECRCAFENFVSDQASMAQMLHDFNGLAWYPKMDLSNISMAEAVKVYRDIGQPNFHDAMTHQTTLQLEIEVAWGEGKIIDKNTVEVAGVQYKGKNLVIGVGSRPIIPNIPGTDLENVWTYIDHPEIRKDPKHLVIVGGGKIGMGKAAMFAPFNIDVTVLEKFTILPTWDWEIRNYIFGDYRRRGIKMHEGVEVKEIKGDGKVESVVAEIDGKVQEIPCDAVMLSTGLRPNSEVSAPLGLKTGDIGEIVIDKGCRTNVPGVYAVGDVAGPPYFMAVARKRGMITAENVMGGNAEWDDTLPIPDHIYVPPMEATTVGLTEDQAREKYGDVVLIRVPWGPRPKDVPPLTYWEGFENQALPVCGRMHSYNLYHWGHNRNGMMKAIVEPESRKYVGFHSVGDGAKVGFQYLSYFLQQGFTIDQMAQLHEIFLNPEHFVQLSRLVAGQKPLKGYAAQVVTEDYTQD